MQKLAGAELVATFSDEQGNPATYYASIVTTPDSGITDLSGLAGHSFAYSDPASTSGHLYPAFALKSSGIDPESGVQAIYAGSHTAAFEALRNHKVDAGELNSDRIATATAAGEYSPEEWVTLWQSAPIPQDPITVRGDLPPAFKNKIGETLLSCDFRTLPPEVQKMLKSDVAMAGTHLVGDRIARLRGHLSVMDDVVERLIQAFQSQSGQAAVAWKRDVLLDLGELRDSRIVPSFLDVLADAGESIEVRLDVLNRVRGGSLSPDERPHVAQVILQMLTAQADPRLRLQAALALGDFTDVPGVLCPLGDLALKETESFDLRYAAFASIEHAGPTPEGLALLRRLSADELLGRSAASMLQAWQVS